MLCGKEISLKKILKSKKKFKGLGSNKSTLRQKKYTFIFLKTIIIII